MSKLRNIPLNSYQVIADYPATDKFDFKLCVKKEGDSLRYKLEPKFNISKKIAGGKVMNGFLVFLSLQGTDNGNQVGHLTQRYQSSFYLNSLAKYDDVNNSDFDDTEDLFIIVFRDNEYDSRYVKYFFEHLESYFNQADNIANFKLELLVPHPDGHLAIPRTAGMTIIRKPKLDQ